MNKIVLITGANGGLGKDTARQLALLPETGKIYLACRNEAKALAAKADLEQESGRSIFEIILMDVSQPESVRNAVSTIKEPIDALILNAGGMGGKDPYVVTNDGVTQIFATNVLGHVVLVDEIVKANLINNVILYAGSEAARGIKQMGIPQPKLQSNSVEEFASIIDGSFFKKKGDPIIPYALVKYIAAMWMSAQARKTPGVRFITMSPGATSGTAVMENLTGLQKVLFKYIMMPVVMPLLGMVHPLATGAKRFVDGISDTSLANGGFYASKNNKPTGPIANQNSFLSEFDNEAFQDNADAAVHQFIR